MILAYHFITTKGRDQKTHCLNIPFRNSSNEIGIKGFAVFLGQELEVDCPPKVAEWGLHASEKALDALYMAPDIWLCKVECFGEIDYANSLIQLSSSKRKIISIVNVIPILDIWLHYIIDLIFEKEEDRTIMHFAFRNKKTNIFSELKKTKEKLLVNCLESFLNINYENNYSLSAFEAWKTSLKVFLIQNPFLNQKQLDVIKNNLDELFSIATK